MNDSFGQISSPARPAAGRGFGGNGQTAQILKFPADLGNIAKTMRLEGQITEMRAGGNATVQTPVGDIDVKIKGNPLPQVGQRVELELSPTRQNGEQARQAVIRTAPNVPMPPESARIKATYSGPLQANIQSQGVTPSAASPTGITSPVPTTVQESTTRQLNNQTAAQANNAKPLLPETLVRLLPAPPAQAQNIATEYLKILPNPVTNIVTSAAFTANLTAQNAQNNLTQTLLQNIAPPPALTTAQNILNPNNSAILQPVQNVSLGQNTQTLLIPTSLAQSIPAIQNAPLITVENISLAPQNIAPQTATLTPALVTTLPTNLGVLTTQPLGKIDVQIVNIAPPLTTLNAPTIQTGQPQIIPAITPIAPPLISANNATTVTAQVTGFTPQNLPLVTVQWPGMRNLQSFILQSTASNLQLGSQLQITPNGANTNAQNAAAINAPRPVLTSPLLMGFQWPAMDELYNTLQQLSPQVAASLSRALPNAGTPNQLAPAAMMIIAAIRAGDIGSWLGDKKMDLLQRVGKSDLVSSLSQNSGTSARAPSADAPVSDWRAVPLPMFWEGEIHKITLYTRQENQSNQQDKNKNGSTRFVFDLSLSRMGDIQLDGLLRDNRLDLVLRAHNVFSLPMQQTMRQAYSNALGMTALTGELNFQGDAQKWVHVLEQKEQLGVSA